MAKVMISRRSALRALGLIGGGFAQRAYAQPVPGEFRVGYQKAGLLRVVKEQGAFERWLKPLGIESVKWSEFELGPPMMEALGAGAIDFGWVGDMPPIFAQAAGIRFVYAACMPESQHALLVSEGSAIHSLEDIKGRKIAFAEGSSAHNVMLRLLAKIGLSYDDIVPVYLLPSDASTALSQGRVDGWVIWDPLFALAERRQQARVIATSREIGGGNSFYVANRDFATKYPKALAASIGAVTEVTQWAAQNRDKLAEAISADMGIEFEVQRIAIGRTNLSVGPLTAAIIGQQQKTADAFQNLGLILKPILVRDAVWSPPSG